MVFELVEDFAGKKKGDRFDFTEKFIHVWEYKGVRITIKMTDSILNRVREFEKVYDN